MKRLETDAVALAVGLIIGLLFNTFNVIGFDFTFFPGDLGDGRLNLYFLEHAHKFFTGQTNSFWNAPFMFPEKNVIAYSENQLGSAPIFSFARLLGFDIYNSFRIWYVAVTALNYVTAFYFLKYVFKNRYAAVLGAFVFAFSIALQSQLTHAQAFPRFATPLAFLMAVKFSEGLEPKYFFYSLLFLVYQLFCGIYLGFMLAVPLGIYLLISIVNGIFFDESPVYTVKWLSKIVVFCLISLAILLPFMLPYMERKMDASLEHYHQIVSTVPTIKSFLYSQEGSLFWDFLSNKSDEYINWWDHQLFTGGIATASSVFLLLWFMLSVFKRKFKPGSLPTVALLTTTGLITFFLYVRFENVSAYIVLYFLPGFSSMRAMTRVINIELIFFSIATAFTFAQLFKLHFRYKPLAVLASFIILVCDNYFSGDKSYRTRVSIAEARTNKLEGAYSKIPEGSIVSYEPASPESTSIYSQIDGMLLAQKHDLITINAYTANSPAGYSKYWQLPNEFNRTIWLQEKNIEQDSLYIVKSPETTEVVAFSEIPVFDSNTLRSIKIQDIINYMKSDEEWMKTIRIKAIENGVSVDSMLILDANWIIENE